MFDNSSMLRFNKCNGSMSASQAGVNCSGLLTLNGASAAHRDVRFDQPASSPGNGCSFRDV
jgi:hypothetical protein